MLLNVEQLKKLKQVNISKDADKTKTRVRADFSALSAASKRAAAEKIGQGLNSILRIYNVGSITPRIALGLAYGLNVTPFYYTGEVDEKEPCSDELVKQFLNNHGYSELLGELKKKKRTYNRKSKDAAETTTDEVVAGESTLGTETKPEVDAVVPTPTREPEKQEASYDLDLEEAELLLRALFVRAKSGGKAAGDLGEVKKILLS